MCRILRISRSGYYKHQESISRVDDHRELVTKIFLENQKAYGTRDEFEIVHFH